MPEVPVVASAFSCLPKLMSCLRLRLPPSVKLLQLLTRQRVNTATLQYNTMATISNSVLQTGFFAALLLLT